MRIFAVTPGDPDGIGAEIVWKAIQTQRYAENGIALLCVGARAPFEKLGAKIIELDPADLSARQLTPPQSTSTSPSPFVWLLPAPTLAPKKSQFLPGFQSGWSIEQATRLVLKGLCAAIVTGPISKERLQKGGYPFPGHTEMLSHLCRRGKKSPPVTMMLANDQLRVTLVTIHTPLKRVPSELTREELRRCVNQTADHLKRWWGIVRPKIAVTGLNPHAGEGGVLGKEEIQIIEPELKALRRKWKDSVDLVGPLPADTLFAKHILAPPAQRYDAVVCMYHDQGLIPVKLLDFPRTVNVTLGLPIVRTSVDHGVGFDIAGQGKADPSSFQAAMTLAVRIAPHSSEKIARGTSS